MRYRMTSPVTALQPRSMQHATRGCKLGFTCMYSCSSFRPVMAARHQLLNTLAALHSMTLSRQVAVDACRDAVTCDVHLVLECPAMQCVRDWYPALFTPANFPKQLIVWQHDIVGVTHNIMNCLQQYVLSATSDSPNGKSTSPA